jgi:hypothetical protein
MRIHLTKVLAALLATTTFSTCGKKLQVEEEQEEQDESAKLTLLSPDSFLTRSELAKGSKVYAITKAEAEATIKNEKDLYDDGRPSAVQMTSDDCISRIVNSIPVKSYDSYIGMGAEADITVCAQQLFPSNITAAPSILRIAFQWGCDNQDFSSFDGKTYGELAQSEDAVCTSSTKIETLLQIKITLAATAGTKLNYEKQLFIGHATAEGKPCTSSIDGSELKHADGCLFTNRDLNSIYKVNGTSDPDEGAENFTQLETSSLVSASGSDNVWFKSGTMKATFNNWTGDVTYTNANTAPTYSITNGTETATGSLGLTKSLTSHRSIKNLAKAIGARLKAVAHKGQ